MEEARVEGTMEEGIMGEGVVGVEIPTWQA